MFLDYQTIKALAAEHGYSVNDLLALSANHDPFYVGKPSDLEKAGWFANLWFSFGYTVGIHLRRIHYRLANGGEEVYMPDGRLYENTERCWDYLVMAATAARYIGLVDPDAFVDRRNPEAVIFSQRYNSEGEPYFEVEGDWEGDDYRLPEIPELPGLPANLPDLPDFVTGGYSVEQPYLVEIWAEKSTMNDVLLPICRQYGANLVTGLGEMSITAVRKFLKRARQDGRPTRILYVSDFDPAGVGMPISVARKIEFYQRNNGVGDLDVVLQPIVLTAEQVERYQLPRIPVKDSDRRKGNFEAAHGEGAVELDALEAIYPGELSNLTEAEILRYYDPDLESRADWTEQRLERDLDSVRDEIISKHAGMIEQLSADYQALKDDFEKIQSDFAEMAASFEPRLAAYHGRFEAIKERARELYGLLYNDLEAIDFALDPYPKPEPDLEGDPDGLLYDSGREYFEQIKAYKRHRYGLD